MRDELDKGLSRDEIISILKELGFGLNIPIKSSENEKLNNLLEEIKDGRKELDEAIQKIRDNIYITSNLSNVDYLVSEKEIINQINKIVKILKNTVETFDITIVNSKSKTLKNKLTELIRWFNAGKAQDFDLNDIEEKKMVENIVKIRGEFLLNSKIWNYEKFTEKVLRELFRAIEIIGYDTIKDIVVEVKKEKSNKKEKQIKIAKKEKVSKYSLAKYQKMNFSDFKESYDIEIQKKVTGKSENYKKSVTRVEEKLKSQPDYISGFYYFMRNSGKTSSYETHEKYLNYVIRFLREINKEPQEVTMDDVTMYLAKISMKEDGSSASESYLVAVYSSLKKFFKYMISSKRMTENPMEHIERPASKKPELVERTYLTKREIKKLFKLMDEKDIWELRDKTILMLFFSTGIRRTALTEINIDNVDFENNCIYVLDKGTKFNTFDLPEDKMYLLAKWIKVRNLFLAERDIEINALFISQKKWQRITPMSTYRIIKEWTAKIGHEISPEDARATFAINALDSGITLQGLSKLMNINLLQATEYYTLYEKTIGTKDIKESMLKATDYLSF